MVRTSDATVSAAHHLLFGLASLLVVVVAAGAVYVWQHHKVTTLNTQIKDDHAALTKDAALSLDPYVRLKRCPILWKTAQTAPQTC